MSGYIWQPQPQQENGGGEDNNKPIMYDQPLVLDQQLFANDTSDYEILLQQQTNQQDINALLRCMEFSDLNQSDLFSSPNNTSNSSLSHLSSSESLQPPQHEQFSQFCDSNNDLYDFDPLQQQQQQQAQPYCQPQQPELYQQPDLYQQAQMLQQQFEQQQQPLPGSQLLHDTTSMSSSCGSSSNSCGGSFSQFASSSSETLPFSNILHRAALEIHGDLMSMTQNFAPEEQAAQRRLVQFSRKYRPQEGNRLGIDCYFRAVQQAEHQRQRIQENMAAAAAVAAAAVARGPADPYAPRPRKPAQSIVVSCIYRRDTHQFFITSVDCIALLEVLLGVFFSVEEKNRIRRNLEGFRPMTVSKSKPDCAEFFKTIMDFPHPKPRNIEKDVKVFAWDVLPQALKKIVRKYTPSAQ